MINPVHIQSWKERVENRRKKKKQLAAEKRLMRKKRKKMILYTWLLLCLIGLSFHFYDTTSKYLKYPTSSQVYVGSAKEIIPPSISICFHYPEIMDPSTLQDIDRDTLMDNQCYIIKNYVLNPVCQRFFEKLNLNEFMINKTVDLEQIIWQLPVDIELEEKLQYFSLRCKCVKLSLYKDKNKPLKSYEMDNMRHKLKTITSLFMDISFKLDSKLQFLLYIHQSNQFIHFRSAIPLVISPEDGKENVFVIDTKIFSSTTLQHPFESNCIKYVHTKYSSEGHCFELCYGGPKGNDHGQVGFVTTENMKQLDYPNKYGIKVNVSRETYCSSLCRIDCSSIQFYRSLESQLLVDGFTGSIGLVITQNEPRTSVIMVSSFDLESYIIYMASVLGLWLGYSVYQLPIDVLSFLSFK